MGPAQKKYKALLDAEAKKKADAKKKPAAKAPEKAKPKGIFGLVGGRAKQLKDAERKAVGGSGGLSKKKK